MLCWQRPLIITVSDLIGNLESGKKDVIFPGHRKGIVGVVGHTGHVQALAVSSDGKFLVSPDALVCVIFSSYVLYRHV